jgi:hypothetical protein
MPAANGALHSSWTGEGIFRSKFAFSHPNAAAQDAMSAPKKKAVANANFAHAPHK